VGHAAAALLIAGQPLAFLAAVLLPPLAMARRAAPAVSVVLWLLALALAGTWAVTTYRAAALAARTGVERDLLGTTPWLGLALLAAVLSAAAAHRSATITTRH
jgi:hypothetical protein